MNRVNEAMNTAVSTSEATVRRNKDQSMGLWLNETLILNPKALDAAIRDLAASGFNIIRIMLRNTNYTHRSPQVVEAVARIVTLAHEANVRVVMDFEPHPEPFVRDLGGLYPDIMGYRVVRGEGRISRGRFVIHIVAPGTLGMRPDFLELDAAFLQSGGKTTKLENLKYEHRVVVEPYDNGFTTVDHNYTEGRPAPFQTCLHVSGNLKDVTDGSVIIYARFSDTRLVDFWSEGTWKYFDQVLDCYKNIPLDGVSWDEPAVGGEWSHYFSGPGFLKAFEKRNGYDLSDRWYLLDEGNLTPESGKVRLDYYSTLNEGVFESQRRFIAKAHQLWGKGLLLGTHHTWQGEGGINDYRAGAVDYFKLGSQMDAGYTDCWWWDVKSTCYAYTLGSSLGRLTPSGEAEVNTWDAKPSNARIEFQSRLMTLMDINWFNLWYGKATDTCLYPADYTWKTALREMHRHGRDQRSLGKAKPVINIAVLHGWETVCAVNRADLAGAHKGFCLNFSEMAILRNVAFDWIDTGLLETSKIKGKQLQNALGSYSMLVMPYASVITPETWKACKAFAAAGGKIIFTGPPPDMDTPGNSLTKDFAALLGMVPLSLDDYLTAVDSSYKLPAYRPERLDVCVEVSGDSKRLLYSEEGEAHGIRNEAGNVLYLTGLDPRMQLVGLLEKEMAAEVVCYSDSILWRLYRDSSRSILVCAAREGLTMRGLIRWAGFEIEITEGKVAHVEIHDGAPVLRGDNLRYSVVWSGTEKSAAKA